MLNFKVGLTVDSKDLSEEEQKALFGFTVVDQIKDNRAGYISEVNKEQKIVGVTTSATPIEVRPEQQEQLDQLKLFMLENSARVEQWYKSHAPNKPMPPVVWNGTEFIWVNRKIRRSNVRSRRGNSTGAKPRS